MALAEADGASARAKLIEFQLGRLDSVLNSIESRLAAAGNTRLADRLTVQTRIAAMQLEIEEERQTAANALADVRGRLGLPAEAALPAFAAPTVGEINAAQSPALTLAAARVAEADAMAKMARASANPGTAVGVRFERDRGIMGNEDTVGIAFSSEIPFRSRLYARADVRAAEAERSAAQANGESARHRIASALSRVDRAERIAETARRLASETRTRLDTQYDALVRAAGAGSATMESPVLMTVEILEKSTEADLKVVQADTAARTARAELWRYVPTSRFITATTPQAASHH
jgi:outer membrane protein TolC